MTSEGRSTPSQSSRPSFFHHRIHWLLPTAAALCLLYAIAFSIPYKIPGIQGISRIFSNRGLSSEVPAKLFHFLSYTLFSLLFLAALSPAPGTPLSLRRRILFLATMVLLILIPEALQRFNPVHHFSLFDLAIDTGGLVLAMIIWRLQRSVPHNP